MIHQFEEFELDDLRCELRRAGAVVPLQPKALALLRFFLTHADRAVSKDDMIRHLWPDETVGDGSLTFCVNVLRKALGDTGAQQRFIKVVRGHGYRFVARVQSSPAGPSLADPVIAAPTFESWLPFVGRDAERTEFERALSRQRAGRGGGLFLVGEAGIGKTRAMHEFGTMAAAAGALVLEGRCYHGDGAVPFWPWIEIIRAFVQRHDALTITEMMGPGAGDIAHLVPSVAEKLGRVPTSRISDSDQARMRLFDSLVHFLLRASQRQALVLCLDDIQWADRSSLLLLQYLARDLGVARLIVVATFRDDEIDAAYAVTSICNTIVRDGNATILRLQRLSLVDARYLLECATGRDSLAATFLDAIAARSEGNPFFLEELARNLVARVAPTADNAAESVQANLARVPTKISNLVAERIVRLSDPARRLLAIAAVIGRQVPLSLLVRLATDFDEDALVDAIDECVRGHVLAETQGGNAYTFAHPLIQETLYGQLSAVRRNRLHRRAAQALREQDPDRYAADIARHWVAIAPELESAMLIDVLLRAARQATSQLAHEAAADWIERALAIAEGDATVSIAERCELLLALGHARYRAGDLPAAQQTFQQAATLAQRTDDAVRFARAALGAVSRRPTIDPVQIELLEEGLVRVGDREPAWRAQMLARLATRLAHTPGTAELRREYCIEAVALARATGEGNILAAVLQDTLPGMWHLDSATELERYAAELLALGNELDTPQAEMTARVWRIAHFLEMGDVGAMNREIATYLRRTEETREPIFRANAAIYAATSALVAGDLSRAEPLIHGAFELGRRLGEPKNAMVVFAIQSSALARLRGGPLEGAEAFLEMARADSGAVPLQWTVPMIRLNAGRAEAAREAFEDLAIHDFADLPLDRMVSGGAALSALAAEACARLGDPRRAALLYDKLAPYADRWAVASLSIACYGSFSRYLGLLAATQEHWSAAESHFQHAVATQAEAPGELALTLADYAIALHTRGRDADRTRSRAIAQQASELANRFGFGAVAQRLTTLIG